MSWAGRHMVRLDVQDGTNCRSCEMTARDCAAHEPGEVGAVCCDSCNHPGAAGNQCLDSCQCIAEQCWGAVYSHQACPPERCAFEFGHEGECEP